MTRTTDTVAASAPDKLAALLLIGFTVSVLLRSLVGGRHVAGSALAGLVFAGCLCTLAMVVKTSTTLSRRGIALGAVGALILCVPVFVFHMSDITIHARPAGSFLAWASVVSVVAAAEEAFLRGTLYEVVQKWRGETMAIIIPALAFVALHIPLYGLKVVPLDFCVGLFLGALRQASGTWTAPAITHVGADLLAWWLV